jgi:HK97 gp10 family phage protein
MSLSSQRLQIKIDAMTKALVYLVDTAVAEAAETIVAEQKSRAPKLTGALAASIKKTKTGPMKYRITAGGILTLKEVREGSRSSYDYAVGQEFGNHHSPAQPYFFSGYRARKRDAKKQIRDTISSELKRAAR